ncbi:histidine--tRNA ligase [Candidatus Nitronereus thalassa]|uniref:Histidine--tRNA ligase n=1 Tax=Candidatus Nitronereus thalassa TaxID=3020898 RepID=A0ABU3K916_9BACT|nr:histidine--tRNA ligase [Candidatus Nitronereus thalassa]MDT7042896.1 histidine--tRNA ligase [Candidatus Nitronereus thalassa]
MIRGIKGVKDIPPSQMPKWNVVEIAAHRLAQSYGFREIRIPIFEPTDLYVRSIGGATDIVEKEMYTFPDRDGSSLTLRPEGTAGVVRSLIEHNLINDPTCKKLYYIGPMFRHERPQAGRFRQFHQFGVEMVGFTSPNADVEVISLLWRFFSSLQLPGLTLEINSLGQPQDRLGYKDNLVAFLKPKFEQLCSNCRRRIDTNPLRVLDCKVTQCRTATEEAPKLPDFLGKNSKDHFHQVLADLEMLSIPYHLNPRLVRGLDYYSMTTFEVSCSSLGAQNAIGAGGRYDGLFEVLGGKPTPAVGFAIGLERVLLALPECMIPTPNPWVFIAGFGPLGSKAGVSLLDTLRLNGITADTDHNSTSLKNLLRSADRLSAPYVLILGDDEVSQNNAILRNMETKAQENISLSEIPTFLKKRFSI